MFGSRKFLGLVAWILIESIFTGSRAAVPLEEEDLEVPRWGVAEFDIHYDAEVENPFLELEASGEFSGPDGLLMHVGGFYDGAQVWKVRFSPPAYGNWEARLRLTHQGKTVAGRSICFTCRGDEGNGFLRISAENPYRFESENGKPFYPLGIQTCGHQRVGMDGPPRGQGDWRVVDIGTFLDAHRNGANLFRIQLGAGTSAGCARQIISKIEGLYRYDLETARELDMAFRQARSRGFATILIPFQDMSLWGVDTTVFGTTIDLEGWKNAGNHQALEPVLHYLRYLVARYAVFTDIWEIFNEDAYTPDEWLREIAAYLRKLDPYRRLITTNYERPGEPWCELVTPHEYMWMPANEVDAHLNKEFARFKSFGKPVLYTEFGNQGDLSNRDPVKWRIAVWSAFMNESAILFWSMGGILLEEKQGRRGNANAYLGSEARAYFRHFQDFVRDLPVTLRPTMIGYGEKKDYLRRYALSNGELTILYLHNYKDHAAETSGDIYLWTGPGTFLVTWIDPATGEVVGRQEESTRSHAIVFSSPPVKIDLAARIERK